MGPTLPISIKTHETKYRSEGESFEQCTNRIADALKDNREHFYAFRKILREMRFLPAGRVQAAVGASRKVTAFNCFVSGKIMDSLIEGKDSIMQKAIDAAATMRMGGGIGYDFSELRPRGDIIKTLQSKASGPVSFMRIYDAVCQTIASAGHRRGAQMGVLRVDHPDIEEFIFAKQKLGALEGFNVSLGITDEFMQAVKDGTNFELRFSGRVYKEIDARALWDKIMRSTWDWAEPGVLFLDTINRMNNLWYCETIEATNPCGEQPLPPNGACLLGSFNLVKYLKPIKHRKDFNLTYYKFDYAQLRADIPPVVRAMDNIIDRTIYPLEAYELEARKKRRMGLGVTGLANAGEALGYTYGSSKFVAFEGRVLRTIMEGTYSASAMLAKEKGPFPLFDKKKYLQGRFIKGLSTKTRGLIARHGIRNSHLTSIAPTGTISLCADNVTSGIEPVFSLRGQRTIIEFDGPQVYDVSDYGWRMMRIRGKTSDKCTAEDHLRVLIQAYKYVDSAVSKTCNVSPSMSWEDFKSIYFRAWEGGCKGCTTFNPGGKRMGILKAMEGEETEEVAEACYIDPRTGEVTCD